MAVVSDPVAKARAVKTRLQAARLHQSIESELALSDSLPSGWEADAEQALSILEDQYDADELRDATVSAGQKSEGFVPSISSGAKRGLGAADRTPAGDASDPRGKSSGASAKRTGKAAGGRAGGGRSGRRNSSRRSGRLPRSIERTGVPAAADSATGFVLAVIGGTVGLVLLYSLLTGRGPQAAQLAGDAFVGGLRAFISPTDPLAPKAGKAPGRGGSTRPSPAPGNAYERGVAAGELAGPPAPGLRPRQLRPQLTPGPGGTGNRPN